MFGGSRERYSYREEQQQWPTAASPSTFSTHYLSQSTENISGNSGVGGSLTNLHYPSASTNHATGGGGVASVTNYESVRVLVVGNSGVGKSSLVHLLCTNHLLSNPSSTIGASLQVKLHSYKEGSTNTHYKPFIIEFVDVGGSNQHETSRHIFYSNYNAVILVHDLTNKKSLSSLVKWRNELLSKSDWSKERQREDFLPVPVLIIGTKLDLAPPTLRFDRITSVAKEIGASDSLKLNCRNPSMVQPGSSCAVTLSKFYDKIIETAFENSQFFNGASSKVSNNTYSKYSNSNLTRIHID